MEMESLIQENSVMMEIFTQEMAAVLHVFLKMDSLAKVAPVCHLISVFL